MKPGIYKDLDINTYHASVGLSSSGIRLLLKSPKKYWFKYISGLSVDDKSSDDQVFGNAVHTAILEPGAFDSRYFVTEKITRSGKKWQDILAAAGGKYVLFDTDYSAIQSILRSISEVSIVKQLIGNGNVEQSLYWNEQETGSLCKTRPDFFNEQCVIEIKTTRDASKSEFAKSIHNYGYHVQAAMQLDGIKSLTGSAPPYFMFIAIEKEVPFVTSAYLLSERDIEQGRRLYKKALVTYQDCINRNYWPGYGDQLEEISLPVWAIDEDLREVNYV